MFSRCKIGTGLWKACFGMRRLIFMVVPIRRHGGLQHTFDSWNIRTGGRLRKHYLKRLGVSVLSAVFLLSSAMPSFAGTWKKSDQGWKYEEDGGREAKGWVNTPSGWFYLDEQNGVMRTGWVQNAKGDWFFLSTQDGGASGRC